jgi:hypothetical protein
MRVYILLVLATALHGQEFDVASIKPSPPPTITYTIGGVSYAPPEGDACGVHGRAALVDAVEDPLEAFIVSPRDLHDDAQIHGATGPIDFKGALPASGYILGKQRAPR